jgi:pimeloyl-ACP methyl ester carboxylesterase
MNHITFNNGKLFYSKTGAGDKVILLFHGFGQDHRAFERWHETLHSAYTMFTFDLFFHGDSTWENQLPIQKENWKGIFLKFIEEERIGDFEIAGFSIGAKFVLTTLELFPDRVKKVILIAPDGIHSNLWYNLATGSSMMRMFFRSMILKPKRLSAIIRIVKFFHAEDRATIRFVEYQTNSEEKRNRVYRSWVYFRRLIFNLNKLSSLINSKRIPLIFILGKSDGIIPQRKIESFANTINDHQVHLLDAGHNELISRAASLIL